MIIWPSFLAKSKPLVEFDRVRRGVNNDPGVSTRAELSKHQRDHPSPIAAPLPVAANRQQPESGLPLTEIVDT